MILISLSSIPSHSLSVVYRRINDEYLLIPLNGNIADMDSLYRLTETWCIYMGRGLTGSEPSVI